MKGNSIIGDILLLRCLVATKWRRQVGKGDDIQVEDSNQR